MSEPPFVVNGVEDFLAVSRRLRDSGELGLRKELNRRIRVAAKPAVAAVRASARAGLPQSGGLNEFIARKRASVQTRTGASPGVRIKIEKQDERLDTEGRVVHPIFFRPPLVRRIVVQFVQPGVMSTGFQSAAPEIRGEVVAAIQSVVDQIVREAR